MVKRGSGPSLNGGVRVACLATLSAGALLAAPAGASAHTEGPARYSLNIVEGESTHPEENLAGVSANAHASCAPVRLRTIRSGAIVSEDTGEYCSSGSTWASYSQVPQVGDVVTVESPLGTVIAAVTYDGLPSIDPTVCAGSTNFSGQRSGAETVSGGYFSFKAHLAPDGEFKYWERTGQGQAQVTLLSGSAFGGSFLNALALGQTVYASESAETPLANGAIFTYESETVRPVGACPAPPAPPPAPPAPIITPLKAALLKLLTPHLRALAEHGLTDKVKVDQAAGVIQELFLKGGRLPASASAHAHAKPALLLARGTASSHAAATVKVHLKPTTKGRGRMLHAHLLHAVLITTIRTKTGSKLTLPQRTLTLHG